MKEINVIRTHVYGLHPHDVYSVTAGEKTVEIEEPSLSALQNVLGDDFIPQGEIADTIDNLANEGGVEFSDEDKLAFAKNDVVKAITAYDQSDAVNQFSIQGMSLWLDSVTRPKLMRRFEAEKAAGQTDTTLWWGTVQLEMSVKMAIGLLNSIEIYACQCFDVTASHKAAVMELNIIEDVVSYDFTTGYPEKLSL